MTKHPLKDDKVADALKNSWVYHLPRWVWPYAQLARWERPIGWQLLMWPGIWSLLLAAISFGANSIPITTLVFLMVMFWAGSFLMRGAGCTYNDLVDVDIDQKVDRTRSRPLPAGRVTRKAALGFIAVQCFAGLLVLIAVSAAHRFAFWVGVASLITVAAYPFMKRITWWPQFFLGLAFSWGSLLGWAALKGEISIEPLLLYIGCIFWVIGYDTIYAHQDREDDALVGVKSTARLFGEKSKLAISILYTSAVLLFVSVYALVLMPFELSTTVAWVGLLAGGIHMLMQIRTLDINNGAQCLRLFKSNNTFGMFLAAGLLGSYLLS